MWAPISTAPFNRKLELAVIDRDEIHALVFPCRRVAGGWVNAETGRPIEVHPTHWREWSVAEKASALPLAESATSAAGMVSSSADKA